MAGASVGRLWRYPIKSMQGEELDQIQLGPHGVVGDRAYAIVDVETGQVASAKQVKWFGSLLKCHAHFLTPPAPGRTPPIEVTFPDGTVVPSDQKGSAELTARASQLAGREIRLVTADPDALGFVDLAQVHMLAASTSHRLEDLHPDGNWDLRRMRPNILVDNGNEPAADDDWLSCDVHLGDEAVVHVAVPTPRCVMTTLAQPGLPKDSSILKAIAGLGLKDLSVLGQSACAGWYADIVVPGAVRRGDPIRVQRVPPRKSYLADTIGT